MKTAKWPVFNCLKALRKTAILHNFSIRQAYHIWHLDRVKCTSPVWLDQVSYNSTFRATPPLSATALLLGLDEPDWTEIELSRGIPTSGLYLQLTVIWMQLIVSSRSTKTELFWVWASSALDSEGVVLWRLTATAGPVCQILMWHKTDLSSAWELGEGLGWSLHYCRGFDEMGECVFEL